MGKVGIGKKKRGSPTH